MTQQSPIEVAPGIFATVHELTDGWGKYLRPAGPTANRHTRLPDGAVPLRVALFGSHHRGDAILDRLRELDASPDSRVQLVGVATDDLSDPNARISMSKRVWRYMTPARRLQLESRMHRSGLSAGVPVFTGKVKTDYFRTEVLADWRPDVIVMGTFGQLIDEPIFGFPRFGHYNLHPSDLAASKGAGGDPFTLTIEAAETETCVTCHWVNHVIDDGHIVGASPMIPIALEELSAFENYDGSFFAPAEQVRWAWIDALHYVTGLIAGDMAVQLLGQIERQGSRVTSMQFQLERPLADYARAVEDVTLEALHLRGQAVTWPKDMPAELVGEPPVLELVP